MRVFEAVGKTEVLSVSADAIRALKESAVGIGSSDVYPSFDKRFGHTLFFFDVRPEFVEWLRTFMESHPVQVERKSVAAPRASRRFSLAEMSIAALVLVMATSLFAWGLPSLTQDTSLSAEEVAVLVDADAEASDDVQEEESGEEPEGPGIDTSIEAPFPSDSIVIVVTEDSSALEASRAAEASQKAREERRSMARVRGELKIWFVDVKQGDGIILRTPGGKWAVIDANKHGAKAMIPLLKKLGCQSIDHMLMSHPHSDHIGDLAEILEEFPVKNFYDPGFPHTTATYKKLLLAVEKNGSDYHVPKPGDKLSWDGGLAVTVLNSGGSERGGANNGSLVVKIQFGSTAALFTGDAEKEAEHEMLAKFQSILNVDLLKVGHHGSKTSTSAEFLAAASPKDAVISCGIPNSYGHPSPGTIARLEKSGIRVHRTDELGTILAISDGRSFKVVRGG